MLPFYIFSGDLWINWEEGVKLFLHYLLDADWAVCAGNWMWVSSSAFEQVPHKLYTLGIEIQVLML